jgi:hypothetical protein
MISIKRGSEENKKKIFSIFVTLGIICLLLLAGPANAITLGITDISSEEPNEDSTVSFLAKLDMHTNDRIPLTNITVYIEYSNGTIVPDTNLTFDLEGNNLSSSSTLSVSKIYSTTSYDASTAGYGYGYGYDVSTGYGNINQSFGYGYAAVSGYGYDSFSTSIKSGSGSTTAEFIYNITWETPGVSSDTIYKIKMYTTANDGSDSADYYLKTPATITVQNVAGTTTSSGGSSKGTYYPLGAEFERGYTKELGENNIVRIKIAGSYHSITIKNIYANSVEIEVKSTPQIILLNVGETKKVEVTGDNYYDLQLTLESITSNKAKVTIQSIYEPISASGTGSGDGITGGVVDTPSDGTPSDGTPVTPSEKKSSRIIFFAKVGLILLIIILLVVAVFFFAQRKDKRKWY